MAVRVARIADTDAHIERIGRADARLYNVDYAHMHQRRNAGQVTTRDAGSTTGAACDCRAINARHLRLPDTLPIATLQSHGRVLQKCTAKFRGILSKCD